MRYQNTIPKDIEEFCHSLNPISKPYEPKGDERITHKNYFFIHVFNRAYLDLLSLLSTYCNVRFLTSNYLLDDQRVRVKLIAVGNEEMANYAIKTFSKIYQLIESNVLQGLSGYHGDLHGKKYSSNLRVNYIRYFTLTLKSILEMDAMLPKTNNIEQYSKAILDYIKFILPSRRVTRKIHAWKRR